MLLLLDLLPLTELGSKMASSSVSNGVAGISANGIAATCTVS
jgi:hypothetical protein